MNVSRTDEVRLLTISDISVKTVACLLHVLNVDFSASTMYEQVVYTATYNRNGAHTLKVEVLGTKNASSSGYHVPVDAFDVVSEIVS